MFFRALITRMAAKMSTEDPPTVETKPLLNDVQEQLLFSKFQEKGSMMVRYRTYEWSIGQYYPGVYHITANIGGLYQNFELEPHWDPQAALNTCKEKWTTKNEVHYATTFTRFKDKLNETYGEGEHYNIHSEDNVLRVVGEAGSEKKMHVIDFKNERLYEELAKQCLWYDEYFDSVRTGKALNDRLMVAGVQLGGWYAKDVKGRQSPDKIDCVQVTRVDIRTSGEHQVYYKPYSDPSCSASLESFVERFRKVKESYWFHNTKL